MWYRFCCESKTGFSAASTRQTWHLSDGSDDEAPEVAAFPVSAMTHATNTVRLLTASNFKHSPLFYVVLYFLLLHFQLPHYYSITSLKV